MAPACIDPRHTAICHSWRHHSVRHHPWVPNRPGALRHDGMYQLTSLQPFLALPLSRARPIYAMELAGPL
jgi:hypothetical protein